MSTKTVKWILLIVGIILIILAFMIVGSSQDRQFYINWNYYFEKGSPDGAFLRIYELNPDSTILRIMADSVNISWTTHRFTIVEDDKQHYFTITAIDTANNESIFSNIAVLDLKRPIQVFGVKIRF